MSGKIENYEQAIDYLFQRVNFERLPGTQYTTDDFKLDRMRELLARLDNPQLSIPAVHIAGTKGKGSTAAFIASILSASGIRTGLFTSPHISAFEERMTVERVSPSPAELVALVRQVAEVVVELDKLPGCQNPTYFEIATALAWLYFREQRAEIVVLEVGMGGRLDSTNVCQPIACVITSISRDHTRHLGSRIEQIAREKAGIIKHGVPVVSGAADPRARQVIEETCRQKRSPLFQLGIDFRYEYRAVRTDHQAIGASVADIEAPHRQWKNLQLPLIGEHQARNLAASLMTMEVLADRGWKISDNAVTDGLARLRWPGRIEILGTRPTIVVDAAHNWAAVAALLRTLDESFSARRRILVFAATRDKDVAGMLRQLLPKFDAVIVTCFQNNPRQVPIERLVEMVQSISDRQVHACPEAAGAWKLARRLAASDDLICFTGSFFLAAEVRDLIIDELSDPPRSLVQAGRVESSARSV